MKRDICLDKAKEAVARGSTAYGPPDALFARIAQRWSLRFGIPITARQVALSLIDLKIERADAGHSGDSIVDIAGYAACLYEIDNV